MLMLRKKGVSGAIIAIFIILLLIILFELVIFSQHVYHGEQQLRALGEAQLLSESSKLETWVRSFHKAAELSLIESSIDSGSGVIILPYEFDWNYSPSNLSYWQIYDNPIDFCNNITNFVTQKFASNYESNYYWSSPENVYSSDDLRASASPSSLSSSSIIYKGFNLEIPDSEIEKVEVGTEWYTTNPSYEILYVSVSWDGGISWYERQFPTQSSESLSFLDFSYATTWNPEKLKEENFRVKLRAYNSYSEGGGGGGCYPNSTYILTFNSTHYIFKNPEEIKAGDLVLCFDGELRICEVIGVDKHFGEWEMLNISIGSKTITLTSNHPILLPEINRIVPAGELKIGDKIYYLKDGKVIPYPINEIKEFKQKGLVYNVKINESATIFSKNFDSELIFNEISSIEAIDFAVKVTTYVDSLLVKVNYKLKKKFICPYEIFENYFKQKISLISLNYLENYRNSFESLSDLEYKIDFSGSIRPRITIDEENISFKNNHYDILSFKRNFSDEAGNKINLTRQTFLTNYLYTKFGKIIKKAINILENDYIGRCLANDSSLPICYHNKLNEDDAKNALKRFEKNFEENDIDASFDLDKFKVIGNNFLSIINISIIDNRSSFVAYDFLNESMKLDFIGLKFAIKTGDLISNEYQEKAKNLALFKNCGNLGILSKKDVCNYFDENLDNPADVDINGIVDDGDPYFFGTCSDITGDYSDICFGNMLYEYKPFDNKVCYFEKIECNECKNGACKASSCFDSDDLNYYTKGYVQYDLKKRYDICKNSNTAIEFYCNNNYVAYKEFECMKDCYCSDGACQFPDSCKQLNNTIINAYGSLCGSEKYNPVADLNKDKRVDLNDTYTFFKNSCDSFFCSSALSYTYNPCGTYNCGNGICEVGENCENCKQDCPCEGYCCPGGFCSKFKDLCPI